MPRRKGYLSRTLPRVRELKQDCARIPPPRRGRRTLPRVRELKRRDSNQFAWDRSRRTLPRVRELKQWVILLRRGSACVAPFPGCVN